MRADVVLMTGKRSFEEGEKAIDRIYEITLGGRNPARSFPTVNRYDLVT